MSYDTYETETKTLKQKIYILKDIFISYHDKSAIDKKTCEF